MAEKQSLETFFEEASPPVDEQEQLSRRKFLTGAVVGGAAGLAVAAGTGAAVWTVVDAEALAAQEAARESAEAELARVQGLVDLYENLEKIGLDAILETGMAAVALPLEAVEVGAKALKAGLDWAEDAMLALAEALPSAQESLLWLEAQVSAVADGIEKLETAVADALNKATDNAIAEALADFATTILDSLPFGLGDRFRDALDGMVLLVTSVDELVKGINTVLLEPLHAKWFSEEEGEGVTGTFVDPLVENVLDPLQAHLVSLSVLADNWQAKLVAPSQDALVERAEIRDEIARYKKDNGFL